MFKLVSIKTKSITIQRGTIQRITLIGLEAIKQGMCLNIGYKARLITNSIISEAAIIKKESHFVLLADIDPIRISSSSVVDIIKSENGIYQQPYQIDVGDTFY